MKDHVFIAVNVPSYDPSHIIGAFLTLEAAQEAAVAWFHADQYGSGHDLVVKEFAGTERLDTWVPEGRWERGGLVSQGVIQWTTDVD